MIDSLYNLIAPIMNHNNFYLSHLPQRSRTGSDQLQSIEIDVALQYNAIMAQIGLLFKKLTSDPVNHTTIIMTSINPCNANLVSSNSGAFGSAPPLFTTEQQYIGLENFLGPLFPMVDITLLLTIKQIGDM